jgi:hypothetical protein
VQKIKFIESSHRYLTEDERDLISVSKFTEKFKAKTDWEKIAKRVANKLTKEGNPTTAKDVLKKWERKRDLSAQIGTIFHSIKEHELLQKDSHVYYDMECKTVQTCKSEDIVKWSIPINELEDNTIYPELMIYDLEHYICGQSDKVIIADGKINIWDFKTDLKIDFAGYSSEWTPAKKLLPPLDHLDECNGNIYSIKMSLYMYMLWKANKGRFLPGEICIEHIHLDRDPENDNIPKLIDGKPIVLRQDIITLPYRKKEVINMLKYAT